MFESDDLDQILSQFDFPEVDSAINLKSKDSEENTESLPDIQHINDPSNIFSNNLAIKHSNGGKNEISPIVHNTSNLESKITNENKITPTNLAKLVKICNDDKEVLPHKHSKRKILDTYFDHKSKRKFPGPAGLLTGNFKENENEYVCQMELLSQDVDFSQNHLHKDAFDSPLWQRLLADLKEWNLGPVDTVKTIKQCSITGSLRRKKAQAITAFIECIDRSISDPLITLRDSTGSIKCTLHRDAWTKFSPYVVSEYCALVLWKPTILTTGSAFKKHYLNITLSNIFAVYSSAVLEDLIEELPEGFVKISDSNFTILRTDINYLKSGLNSIIDQSTSDTNNFLDGLDNIFSDEIF